MAFQVSNKFPPTLPQKPSEFELCLVSCSIQVEWLKDVENETLGNGSNQKQFPNTSKRTIKNQGKLVNHMSKKLGTFRKAY